MESASVPRHPVPPGEVPGRAPRREPASEGPVGWKLADPGPLGLAGIRPHDLRAEHVQREPRQPRRRAGGAGAGPCLRRDRPAARRDVGVPHGNTFGAVAFSSFGAFWISFWALVTFFADSIPAEHLGASLGLYLIAWGIFTTYMFVASLRTTVAIAAVFLLLAATFFLLGIGNANESEGLVEVGGWFGIATAAAAWYASFAAVVNSTFGRTMMPVKPLNAPRATEPARD